MCHKLHLPAKGWTKSVFCTSDACWIHPGEFLKNKDSRYTEPDSPGEALLQIVSEEGFPNLQVPPVPPLCPLSRRLCVCPPSSRRASLLPVNQEQAWIPKDAPRVSPAPTSWPSSLFKPWQMSRGPFFHDVLWVSSVLPSTPLPSILTSPHGQGQQSWEDLAQALS